MVKLTSFEKNKVQDFIKNSLKDDSLELEISMFSKHYKVTKTDFINLIKKLKGLGLQQEKSNDEYILDVFFEKENNIRMSIHGDKHINKYCNTNSIKDIKENIEFIEKKRFSISGREVKPLELRDYNLRINLKSEKNLGPKTKIVQSISNRLNNLGKTYRYKKRFSFISSDKLFRFDITLVKNSSVEEIVNEKRKVTKKEVDYKMKTLVIKPKNVEFNEWWNSLDNDTMVSLREDKFIHQYYFKNLKESDTLTNEINYEIELEFIGNKNTSFIEGDTIKDKEKYIYEKLCENLKILLQSIQQNEFIISNNEKKKVRYSFKDLTNQMRFSDSIPLAATLERHNMVELPNLEYKEHINIRRDYCVTDKVDGERNLLFIDERGEGYLLNRQNIIKKIGIRVENYVNVLIDGEYITKTVDNMNIRRFMAFDLYFSNGEDYRERILIRSSDEINSNSQIERSRLEELKDFIRNAEIVKEDAKVEFIIIKKNFRYGNIEEYDNATQNIIDNYIINLREEEEKEEPDIQKIKDIKKNIKIAKQDTSIFEESMKILSDISSKTYDYHTDGLIFTPVNATVGEGESRRNKYGGGWQKVLKWKPSSENSIDFKVKFIKDDNGKNIEKYITTSKDVIRYLKVKLMVGYHNENHKKINGLRYINENPQYLSGYSIVPFEPIDPFANKIYEANIKIGKNGITCENGDKIDDGSIIEFSYNQEGDLRFCWVPLRKRDNLVPNSFATATNIWRSVFYPISVDMISTGDNIPNDNLYYSSDDNKSSNMKSVYRFHNLVKKALIHSNCSKGNSLLDLACGELGDLYKYISGELSFVVGIDNNKNNLINRSKGATTRIIDLQNKNIRDNIEDDLINNIFVIWGDCGKNIASSEAGIDSLNKFYIDMLWGNIIDRKHIERLASPKIKSIRGKCREKFDIISCQFAMHYFFKNKTLLDTFLNNITDNLKVGGKFIATCFDGRKIFKMLKSSNSEERKDENDKLLWRITKKYKQKKLLDTDKCLGMPIDVYIETFNDTFEEYLVNIEYLKSILEPYGLEITSIKSFEDYYNEIQKQAILKEEVNEFGKEFSYLNMSLVITKKKEIMNLEGGNIVEEETNLDIFVKNIVDSEEELSEEELSEEELSEEELSEDELSEDELSVEDENETKNSNFNTNNMDKIKGGNLEEIEIKEIDIEQEKTNENENLEEELEEELEEVSIENGKVLDLDNLEGGSPKETLEKMEKKIVNNENIDNEENKDLSQNNIGLKITRLKDIYLGPDFGERDINELAHEDRSDPIEMKQPNEIKTFNQVEEYESLNSLNSDLNDLNQSVLELKDKNFESSVEENPYSPTTDQQIKVIKLNVDSKSIGNINK